MLQNSLTLNSHTRFKMSEGAKTATLPTYPQNGELALSYNLEEA